MVYTFFQSKNCVTLKLLKGTVASWLPACLSAAWPAVPKRLNLGVPDLRGCRLECRRSGRGSLSYYN